MPINAQTIRACKVPDSPDSNGLQAGVKRFGQVSQETQIFLTPWLLFLKHTTYCNLTSCVIIGTCTSGASTAKAWAAAETAIAGPRRWPSDTIFRPSSAALHQAICQEFAGTADDH